jgi:hypothetical protein
VSGQCAGPLDPQLPTVQLGPGDPHRRVGSARYQTECGDRQGSDDKQPQIAHIGTFRLIREKRERVLGLITLAVMCRFSFSKQSLQALAVRSGGRRGVLVTVFKAIRPD